MGPRDWFETIKEVVKKIGSTGDTGGSQTEGTVFAKENEILGTLKNGGTQVIKSLQRGVTNFFASPNTNYTREINIAKVDVNKSVIFLEGGPGREGHYAPIRIKDFTSESFTAECAVYSSGVTAYDVFFSWTVVEFY